MVKDVGVQELDRKWVRVVGGVTLLINQSDVLEGAMDRCDIFLVKTDGRFEDEHM